MSESSCPECHGAKYLPSKEPGKNKPCPKCFLPELLKTYLSKINKHYSQVEAYPWDSHQKEPQLIKDSVVILDRAGVKKPLYNFLVNNYFNKQKTYCYWEYSSLLEFLKNSEESDLYSLTKNSDLFILDLDCGLLEHQKNFKTLSFNIQHLISFCRINECDFLLLWPTRKGGRYFVESFNSSVWESTIKELPLVKCISPQVSTGSIKNSGITG